ncbi:unnamed protein product [Didymodactylos carnosus]|uniref:Uncharacterized protein n=1 Tax=Didymodactylos carnosus TaxID=1234261 RepID=A0A8S2N4T8_9BILA|nr:unnamed protein product [Didymodactylos carnosus]CAF3976471.1 unnamed protein product [Didymodactylos carnosus]
MTQDITLTTPFHSSRSTSSILPALASRPTVTTAVTLSTVVFNRDKVNLDHISWSALRQHNIELMFVFGFFSQDIRRQLKEEHEQLQLKHAENPKIKLYCGQVISPTEIDALKKLGALNYNVNNCLLSTSLDRSVALDFLKYSIHSKGLELILFEIDVDVHLHSRPYGNVSHVSYFPNEAKILFMIGAQSDMRYDIILISKFCANSIFAKFSIKDLRPRCFRTHKPRRCPWIPMLSNRKSLSNCSNEGTSPGVTLGFQQNIPHYG